MPLEIRLDSYTDAVVLTGRGDIGVTCTKRLVAALRRAVEIPKPLVVVDFSRVEHCGSVGLAALVLATRTAAPRPVRVVPSTYIRPGAARRRAGSGSRPLPRSSYRPRDMTGADRRRSETAGGRPRSRRTTLDLHVIARLEPDCAVADLFSSEIRSNTIDSASGQQSVCGWSDSVRTAPGSPISLDALDYTLDARGYVRVSGWHAHITAAGVLRYFAIATVEIDETVT